MTGLSPQTEAFILAHLSLVDQTARKIKQRLPSYFRMEDLVQAGRVGLVTAARTIDPLQYTMAQTESYCRTLIKRAILNSCVGPDWIYATRSSELEARDDHPIPEQAVETPQNVAMRKALEEAKQDLSPLQRELLDLAYEQGVSIWDMQRQRLKVRGCGWKNARKEIESALDILRKRLLGTTEHVSGAACEPHPVAIGSVR